MAGNNEFVRCSSYNKENEHAESVKLLYKFFCNNLVLGQWESACACIKQLQQESEILGFNIENILKTVAENPFCQSIGSSTVATPAHLSWLCMVEYHRLQKEDMTEERHPDFAEIDFRLLLYEACREADASVIQELYQCFICKNSSELQSGPSEQLLSKATLTFLKHTLNWNASLGYALIASLTQSEAESKDSENLQLLYLQCLDTLLDTYPRAATSATKMSKLCDSVYVLLGMYDPVPYWNYIPLRRVFTRLLQLLTSNKDGFKKDKIASVLMGRNSSYLIEEFTKLELELTLGKSQSDDERRSHSDAGALTDEQNFLLLLCQNLDRDVCWRKLLQMSITHEKHILEMVLDTALCLIRLERFEELNELLLPVEFHPLKNVILLLGWSHCQTSSVARNLLNVLWDKKAICYHPALTAGCRKLAYQVDLIQWCLDKARPLLESSSSTPLTEKGTHLLHGLETHSVLFVLHQSTSLELLEQSEVLDLLQNSIRKQDDGGEKKTKNVRFIIDGEEQEGGGVTKPCDENQPISIEQERDIAIYRAYCCIKNVMDVLKFSSDHYDLELMNPFCVRRPVRCRNLSRLFSSDISVSSSEGDDSASQSTRNIVCSASEGGVCDADSFEKLYQQYVTARLHSTVDHLKKLHPLTYRVEVMEDIFSLLFVMHDDVQDSSMITELDSGEEEAQTESKRSSQDAISEEEVSPFIRDDFFTTAIDSTNKSQNISANYDEPFIEKQAVSHSVINTIGVLEDRVFHEEAKLVQNNSSSLSRLRKTSTGDKGFVSKFGYLANEYIVRDILAMLKDSLVDLGAVRYELLGQTSDVKEKQHKTVSQVNAEVEQSLLQLVKSSVSQDALQTRLTRLTQYIHEAQWRFQLVSHEQLPRQPGIVLQKAVFVIDDDIASAYVSDGYHSSKIEAQVTERRSGSQNNKRSSDEESVRPRRSSQQRNRSESRCLSPFVHDMGIIPLMLSSPDTLLVMSLTKGNYVQASQVIKLFKLDGQVEALEVGFSEAYKKAALKLQNLESRGRDITSKHLLGKLSIKCLANVAAVGLASASLTNVTEDLLMLPNIPEPAVPKGWASAPDPIRRLFKDANSSSAILLDLVCTSCRTWDLCSKLFDIYKTNVKTSSSAGTGDGHFRDGLVAGYQEKKSKYEVKLKGFSEFRQQLEDLILCTAEDDSSLKAADLQTTGSIPKHSLEYHLTKATCPLSADESVLFYNAWRNMKECTEKVIAAFVCLNQTEKIDTHSLLPLSQTSSTLTSPVMSFGDTTATVTSHGQSKVIEKKSPPSIHTAFKQLISVMDKQIPMGGIIYLLKKLTGDKHDKKYLQSLYDHIKLLAFLVAECQSKTKESLIVPQNYFTILQEGPVAILGRLMFVKKMIPARLEAVAQNLSLNLTHIIVHSCCPRIPSKHLPLVKPQHEYERMGTKVIYNSGVHGGGKGHSLDKVVQTILTRLLSFMKDIAAKSNAKGIFDITSAKLAIQSAEYAEIISMTRELQTSDLTLLKSREVTLCFLANLQNVMTIHKQLDLVWIKTQSQVCTDTDGSRMVGVRNVQELCPVYAVDNIVQLKQFAYRVGQLGVISLFDLKFIINRYGLQPPTRWNGILHHAVSFVDASDPWSTFASYCEPKLLFVLSDGCLSSPPMQVLTPDFLDIQLQKATKDFLQHTVAVDLEAKRVSIPALLHWYREDFSQESENPQQMRLEGLLNFVAENLSEVKAADLCQLLDLDEAPENIDMSGKSELPFTVKKDTHSSEFGFIFEMDLVATGVQTHRRINSLPKNFETSTDSFLQSYESAFVVEKSAYRLTPTTLDYVKNDSTLVATLVSLVCADELDDLEIELEDEHFLSESAKSRSTSMSDISLVDIRSYRYQRLTEDFPILQRHLLNYIVPIAAVDKPEICTGDEPILKFVTNEIDDKVKLCMLSLHDSIQFQDVITDTIKRTCTLKNWEAVLKLFQCIPEMIMSEKPDWKILHDFVLGCWAMRSVKLHPDSSDLSDKLKSFYCCDTQARTVLAVCDFIPDEHGIDLLEACRIHPLSGNLRETLEHKLKTLRIYSQITDSVKSLQFKLSTKMSEFVNTEEMEAARSHYATLEKFTDWRVIVAATKSSPKQVLAVLIQTGDFETVKTWASLHGLPDEINLEIDEHYILSLLRSKTPNTAKAFQVLEDLHSHNAVMCLSMCESLLKKLSDYTDIQFIASYIINTFRSSLTDQVAEQHRLRLIGAKALLCLPPSLRGEYSHLITMPHLILEQLLMNMKVDLAGQVFHKIKHDFTQLETSTLNYTTEQFNELLIEYATKAVEVTVVQVIETEKERSTSSCSGGSGKMDDGDMTASTTRFLGDSVRMRRKGIDGTVSPKTVTGSPLGTSPSVNKRIMKLASARNKFVMPVQPPPKEKWIPDTATAVCMVCSVERFSMFNRRHHCRRCGRVVCAACSTKRTVIGGESSRTCDECYEQIYIPSELKSRHEREFYSNRRKESFSGVSPASHGCSPARVGSPEGMVDNQGLDIQYDESMWQLRTDAGHNSAVRDDFYYEQAPTVSLCMSIIHLHSDQQQCSLQMLKMCDYLSEFLQPVSPGVPNPEVDYALIISMMLQLLFQAKLKFLKCGDNQGLGMCDMYQIRVDLLKILVSANYKDLPSIQELTKVDTIRRLRDKLIENERLSLAMEVSTKCGIDPSGVWASWGMACFHRGEYTAAREKFSHCLKAPKDRNQSSTSSHLLSEIVDYLEHMPSSGMTEIQMFQSNQGSLKSLVNFPTANNIEESSIDTTPFQECLFYLREYGTYREHLGFLRRNGYLMKAAKYISDHKCSTDVFIESLLEPVLLSGELNNLLDQMLMLDTSLEKWNIYLTAACRHLVKLRLFNSLYQVQLFMKDFIRAAMTCISHFYQHRAQSYRDLAGRIHYLFTAQQHMQAYLDPAKWGSVRHPNSSPLVKKGPDWSQTTSIESTVRMMLSPDEVAKYMHAIALQIEVTNFLEQCLVNMEGEATAMAASCTAESQMSDLPSLFGNTKVKSDLVCMILLSGNDINVSFDLSYRIIKECHLHVASIFNHTAREMAKRQRYGLMNKMLECIAKTSIGTDDMNDEIIGTSLLVIVDKESEAKEAENLIKLLKKESNKINAFILCGKLRSAYLLAVKGERVEDVQRIAGAAQRMGQSAVRNICTKWLQQRKQQ